MVQQTVQQTVVVDPVKVVKIQLITTIYMPGHVGVPLLLTL